MIRFYNGVRLLSSHLIRDSCKSVCDQHKKLFNLNNRMLSNASIRGSASLSTHDDYETDAFAGGYFQHGRGFFPYEYDERLKILVVDMHMGEPRDFIGPAQMKKFLQTAKLNKIRQQRELRASDFEPDD